MSTKPSGVCGVLVTFRRPLLLRECLARIEEQTLRLDRLVVVDNAASDDSREIVKASRCADRIEHLERDNIGPAGGFALGVRHLLEDLGDRDLIVLFDDNDPAPTSGVIRDLANFLDRQASVDPSTAGVGLRGATFDWRRARAIPILGETDGPIAVDHLYGGYIPVYRCAAIRHDAEFSPDLFFGFEELDFGLQLTRAGHRLYMHGSLWSQVRSLVDVEEPRRWIGWRLQPLSWRRYYSLRNLLFILRAHDRRLTAWRVALSRGIAKPVLNLPVQPKLAAAHLTQNLRAIRDAFTGRMGRTLEPVSDAA